MYILLRALYVQATFTKLDFLIAFQLAIDYGIKFLETSAKSSTNVEEVRNEPSQSFLSTSMPWAFT